MEDLLLLLLLLLEGLAEDLGANGGGHKLLLLGLVALGGAGATTLPGVGHRVGIGAERQAAALGLLLGGLVLLAGHGRWLGPQWWSAG